MSSSSQESVRLKTNRNKHPIHQVLSPSSSNIHDDSLMIIDPPDESSIEPSIESPIGFQTRYELRTRSRKVDYKEPSRRERTELHRQLIEKRRQREMKARHSVSERKKGSSGQDGRDLDMPNHISISEMRLKEITKKKKKKEEKKREKKRIKQAADLSSNGSTSSVLNDSSSQSKSSRAQTAAPASNCSSIFQREKEIIGEELKCSICNELFIEAHILNCSHSFCLSCIQTWKWTSEADLKSPACPICRVTFTDMTKQLVLDNLIQRSIADWSLEEKQTRQQLIRERNIEFEDARKNNEMRVRAARQFQISINAQTVDRTSLGSTPGSGRSGLHRQIVVVGSHSANLSDNFVSAFLAMLRNN